MSLKFPSSGHNNYITHFWPNHVMFPFSDHTSYINLFWLHPLYYPLLATSIIFPSCWPYQPFYSSSGHINHMSPSSGYISVIFPSSGHVTLNSPSSDHILCITLLLDISSIKFHSFTGHNNYIKLPTSGQITHMLPSSGHISYIPLFWPNLLYYPLLATSHNITLLLVISA